MNLENLLFKIRSLPPNWVSGNRSAPRSVFRKLDDRNLRLLGWLLPTPEKLRLSRLLNPNHLMGGLNTSPNQKRKCQNLPHYLPQGHQNLYKLFDTTLSRRFGCLAMSMLKLSRFVQV